LRGKGWVVAVALALAALPTPARAVDLNAIWPDLGLPGFRVTPFLSERIEYESNVFQVAHGAQDSAIFKTIPGFTLELPLGRHRFDLGFRTEILRYTDLGSQNTENYFVIARGLLDFPGGLKFTLKEDFAHTNQPPNSELTGPIENTTNTFSPSIEYALTQRYSLGLEYAFTHVSFSDQSGVTDLDRNEHLVTLAGFYKVQPKTDLLVAFAYGRKNFANATERDVNRYLGLVGVRGDITSRLSSTLRVGYESRQPTQDNLTGFTGLVANGDITFVPTERTKMTLYLERSAQESEFQTNLFYISNIASLSVEHFFTPKLLATGRVYGGSNDYPDKGQKVDLSFDWRRDWLVGAFVGAEYQIQKWLGVSLDYSFTRRESNFNTLSFKDNIVGGKVTVSY
jgi:polysaccharide biosynthesis protein VpsM